MGKTRRLFIFGAGCSYAAGLPDGDRLASQLFGYIGAAPWEAVYNAPPYAYWEPLYGTLESVLRELATGGLQSRWALDRVFDSFHVMMSRDPYAFGATWGLLFEATAHLLYTRSWTGGTTDAYRTFIEALEPGDIILTFNWDTCLEIALHLAGRPFQRVLDRGAPDDMPWLLKIHGSIDYVIVNAGCSAKGGCGWPEFLEPLGAEPPSPHPGKHYELARLRSYDLGYTVQLSSAVDHDRETDAMPGVLGAKADVDPFLLTHALEEYPTFHMLTPGSPRPLYDWQYDLVVRLLASACPEVGEIFVAGYSFPAYDKQVHSVLRKIHRLAGEPPTHIVNPAAAALEPRLMKSILGRCELHACGFGDYEWRRRPVLKSPSRSHSTTTT